VADGGVRMAEAIPEPVASCGALLRDRVILVTGAASGIGLACAAAYCNAGALVAIADRDAAGAEAAAQGIGERTLALTCDAGDAGSVEAAVRATIARFGRLDAVHNNAGISTPSKSLHETSEAEWDELQRINLKSVFLTTKAAFDALVTARGCILNTASMVGWIGQEHQAAYVATKGGMIALTKAMALDYAAHGIRVNAICPAGVRTPLLTQWIAEHPDPDEMEHYLAAIHPLGYCPDGDVIADAAVFLLSDLARFITGCILPVSGGAELGYRR
jgi:meso-butanediol dehydrogenase/(S,S)-butanediol dehydrogenase/diacetyl reductase